MCTFPASRRGRTVGRWYAQLIAPQFALDTALRQALAQVLAGKTSEQEKIQAIHQFVLRNTHYVALEFGVYGYKPYPVSQVYARRFGDCKDKASLMIALLRASRHRGRHRAGAHATVGRHRGAGDLDLDLQPCGGVRAEVRPVARRHRGICGIARVAAGRPGRHGADRGTRRRGATAAHPGDAADGKLHSSPGAGAHPARRKIEFTGSAYTRGEDAPGLRREYEVAERQRDSVRNRLAEILPSVRVDTVQVYGANDLERDVTVKFSGEVEMFAGRPSLRLATSWMPRSYVQTLASLPSRAQDLLLPAPWTTEEELHFALPAGARLDSVPQDKMLETPFGTRRSALPAPGQRTGGDNFGAISQAAHHSLRISRIPRLLRDRWRALSAPRSRWD